MHPKYGSPGDTLHNFSDRRQALALEPGVKGAGLLVDVFDDKHSRSANGTHEVKLEPYGYRWFRVGAAANALNRAAF